ncbi:MAG TPA: hypothetical protein VJ867_05620 [Gemmatimonadaceae bacterium]|nr:hypothetical protein [Gemmatimonadaceae bacterium]
MRALLLAGCIVFAGAAASAQGTKAPATKQPATATKQSAPPATKQAPSAATKQAGTGTGAAPQRRPALVVAPETGPSKAPPVIMREVFAYDAGGRRDPFFSLLTSTELRPTVADLKLVVVLFDQTGRRPVAVMRDVTTNTQYRVTTGMTLGRMRVSEIKPKTVIFTIEEFGLNRQDSLVLGDTTKARAK